MRMSVGLAALLGYVVPSLSAPYVLSLLGFDLSKQAIIAIYISALAGFLGFAFGRIYLKKKPRGLTKNEKYIARAMSVVILPIGLASIFLLFISTRSIPLISGGDSRLQLQSSILWNIYILCSVGLYLRGLVAEANEGWHKNFISNLYLVTALLTAWKGTLFLFLLMRYLPQLRGKRFDLKYYLFVSVVFLAFFIFINGFRGDRFDSAIFDPVYYAYWGFVNFDTGAIEGTSGCLHTLPLIGCQFAIDGSDLVNSTFNVFTALSPIYRDGGNFLIFIFFASFGFLIRVTDARENSLIGGYLFVVSFYFFLFSTNGYIFNSSFYISAFFIILVAKLLSIQRQIHSYE